MPKFNYITPIGDDFIIPLTFFQADGVTPANLTGCAIAMLLKPFDDLPDNDPSVITIAGVINNPTGGLAYVAIPNATTVNYNGSLYHKIKLTTEGGTIITFAYGVTTFTQRGSTLSALQLNALVINLGTGVTVTGGGAYYVWNQVSAASQTLQTNNAYIPTGSTLTTFTLPVLANVGDHYIISGMGSGGWKLAQNASQSITIGVSTTTVGVTGYLASTKATDVVEVVCIGTNQFNVISSFGNITVN